MSSQINNDSISLLLTTLTEEKEALENMDKGLWMAHSSLCELHKIDKFQAYNEPNPDLPKEIISILEQSHKIHKRQNQITNLISALLGVDLTVTIY